jgi:hypothetical protein
MNFVSKETEVVSQLKNIFTFSGSYGGIWSTGLRGTSSRILRRGWDTGGGG